MKRTLKTLATLLCIIIVLTMFVSCGKKEGEHTTQIDRDRELGTKTQGDDKDKLVINKGDVMPIVNKPITLRMMASIGPFTKGEFSEVEIWEVYEKMTGIKVEWEAIPRANVAERVNIVLASQNLPDAFFRVVFSPSQLMKYGPQGTFLAINEYMDEYTPNLVRALETYPDARQGITMLDGKIYGFPEFIATTPSQVGTKMYINHNWLDAVSMEIPTDIDGLYELLKTFKTQDPNKNGIADEIPLTSPLKINAIVDCLKGAWGLGTRGSAHSVDVDPTTGQLRFIPVQDGYRELLEFINKLYKEKLLDEEIFTMDHSTLAAYAAEDLLGVVFAANSSQMGKEGDENFVGFPVALKGPYGDQLYASYNPTVSNIATMTITASAKYPQAIARWTDYFYSESGQELFFMGIEGKTFERTPDGGIRYTEYVIDNPDGMSYEEVLGNYVVWSGFGNPTVVDDKNFGDHAVGEITRKAAQNMIPFAPKIIWPPCIFDTEDEERMEILGNDITTYINDMRAKFITGEVGMDKWDNYVSKIKEIGLKEYLEIYGRGIPKE